MLAKMTGVPTTAAHIDMTHAGPHGQLRYPFCPESSPADPCSAQIALEATASDARQEMIRNPDIVICIAMTEAKKRPVRLLKARQDLILVGNRANCLHSYPAIRTKRFQGGSARYSWRVVAYAELMPGLNALMSTPSAATRESSTGFSSDVPDRQLSERRTLRFVQARTLGPDSSWLDIAANPPSSASKHHEMTVWMIRRADDKTDQPSPHWPSFF
jgi:hypothetical protein